MYEILERRALDQRYRLVILNKKINQFIIYSIVPIANQNTFRGSRNASLALEIKKIEIFLVFETKLNQ